MNIKLASAWTFLKFIVSGVSNSHFMTEGRALMSYDFGLQSLELAKLLEISGAGYNTQLRCQWALNFASLAGHL